MDYCYDFCRYNSIDDVYWGNDIKEYAVVNLTYAKINFQEYTVNTIVHF